MLIIMISGTASCLARTWFSQYKNTSRGGRGEEGVERQAIQDEINWDTGSHAHFNSFKPGILFVGHRQIA